MREEPSRRFTENPLDYLFISLQYLLPHHLISALTYRITRIEIKPFKDWLIRNIIKLYRVEMKEALEPDPSRYRSFNHFFTRVLRPDVRPVAEAPEAIACPADGALSQCGDIEEGYIFQAKGRDYSLLELLGGDPQWSERFEEGNFATIYLSPRDYHRVHMPFSGTLQRMIHVPGRLFSVNATTARMVPRLFARNERVVCLFETEIGPMAMILVGAINVASIDTVWAGTVTPRSRQVSHWNYTPESETPEPISLQKGEEMGRFNMGSTVILLFGKDATEWMEELESGMPLKMGQQIATVTPV